MACSKSRAPPEQQEQQKRTPPLFFFNKKNATFFFLWFIFDTFFFFCFWPKRERENGHRLTFESSGGARRLILGVASDVFCGPIFLFGFLPFFLPILSTKTFFYRFLHFGARRSGVVFLFFFPLFRPFFLFFLGSLVYRVFFYRVVWLGGFGWWSRLWTESPIFFYRVLPSFSLN